MRRSILMRTATMVAAMVLLAASALVVGTTPVWANGPSSSSNSCVKCHSILPSDTFLGKRYHVWKGSIHARMDITCNLCHGGNPKAADKDGAHQGVFNSGRPQSSTYFKNVPSTCGGCHRLEYNRFKRSVHFKELQTTGRGPNCVTCHESKTGQIIHPTQVVETCSVCHNERLEILPQIPVQAYGVLLRMNFAAEMQSITEQLVSMAEEGGQGVGEAEQKLEAAREGLSLARIEWHTFSLNKVEASLNDVFKNLRDARDQSTSSKSPTGASSRDEAGSSSRRLATLGGGGR